MAGQHNPDVFSEVMDHCWTSRYAEIHAHPSIHYKFFKSVTVCGHCEFTVAQHFNVITVPLIIH